MKSSHFRRLILLFWGLLLCFFKFNSSPVFAKHSSINNINYVYIDVIQRKLYLISGKDDSVLREYSVGLGKSGEYMTPEGEYSIINKSNNPGWLNPYKRDARILPGNENPLGTRWMGFFIDPDNGAEYGIHGTNDPKSIGKFISHGCVRMNTRDAEELFSLVKIGTQVVIEYERLRIELFEDDIALTILDDPYLIEPLDLNSVKKKIRSVYPNAVLNEESIKRLLKAKPTSSGITRLVGSVR